MQVFQELTIRGTPEQIVATAEGICARVADPWMRNAQLEAGLKPEFGVSARCFERAERGELRSALLFLGASASTALTVPNIVTRSSPALNCAQYNALLNEFTNLFVRPAAGETGATVELSSADADLEHWLAPVAAKKLRDFCHVANLRQGWRQANDQQLWNDFVVAAHRTRSPLNADTLERWLREVEGWEIERAEELAAQYERERRLLKHADGLAVGA